MNDEGVLDPWVAEWLAANPERSTPFEDLDPVILELARGPVGFPPTREIAHITDEQVGDVPVRIYQGDDEPTGLVVYFHGGGFVKIGTSGSWTTSPESWPTARGRLWCRWATGWLPEDPYPAGLDDCESVTRWALADSGRFGLAPSSSRWPARAPAGTWPRRYPSGYTTPENRCRRDRC